MFHKARILAKLQLWCLDVLWQSRIAGVFLIAGEWIYLGLSRWHKRKQLKALIRVPLPVIVVGNITIGGTGKTPMTRALACILHDAGFKPGIISRGYGGKSKERLVTRQCLAEDVGDEALMLATDFPVAVGRDRALSVQCLIESGCDILISDDGLQHYRLLRDIEIVMVEASRGFGNGRCLPAGPLREKVSRLYSANYILSKKVPYPHKSMHILLNHTKKRIPLHYWKLATCGFRNLKTGRLHQYSSKLLGKEINAIAGISNPKPFFESLRSLGLRLHVQVFPDHHPYNASELIPDNELPVVLTEKDAVKCRALKGLDLKRYWSLEVEAKLTPTFQTNFLKHVEQIQRDLNQTN